MRAGPCRPRRRPGLEARWIGAGASHDVHGDGGDAEFSIGDPCFTAGAFAHAKGMVEEAMEYRAAGPLLVRQGVSLFDLVHDLALADDDRVEAADDSEKVSDRARVVELVEVGCEASAGMFRARERNSTTAPAPSGLPFSVLTRISTRLQVLMMTASAPGNDFAEKHQGVGGAFA